MKQKYIEKFVKNFDSFIEKTIFKVRNKTNYFFKKYTATINFNKLIIGFIFSMFIYLFYLSIPNLYEKTWVQNTIENKLIEEYKIDFSVSADITYHILPSPHFLIKDAKIFTDNEGEKNELSEIKKLKVFINQKYFFDKNKLNINKVAIHDANFSLKNKDLILLNKVSHKKFSNKKIEIYNGNIFFKDNEDQTVIMTKLNFGSFFFDDTKNLNLFNLEGNFFNIPYDFYLHKNFFSPAVKEINFKAKKLKLNINDKSIKTDDGLVTGENTISSFGSQIYTKYNVDKKLIFFGLDTSKEKNSNKDYRGNLSFEPFELNLKIFLKRYNLFKLIDFSSILGELFKSKLLFNENLSANISVDITNNKNKEIFSSSSINLNIENGKINFNKTNLTNDKIGILKIDRSNLFFENKNLMLNSEIIIDVNNSKNLFSFLQTPKKFRKPIKQILVNFDYNLSTKQLNINNIKIDGNKSNNEMLDTMNEISRIEKYNLNIVKRIFNKFISAYAG